MIDQAFFPYGRAAFQTIRRKKQFFVDNTAYIKEFEKNPLQCFTRPPRWGKSLLIQILMCYYDKATTPDEWDLFSGLAIHKNPTELRGHFQVLKLDFSAAVNAGSVEKMSALLTKHINSQCLDFGAKYGYAVSTEKNARATNLEVIVLDENDGMYTLTTLAKAVRARGEELYLFVDEYDRYANVCLLDREDVDQDGYRQAVIDTDSLIKRFFSMLKSIEADGCLLRVFVTGVLRLAISDAFAFNNILLTSAERAVGPALGFPLEEIKRGVRALELGAAGEERQRFEAEALALIKNYCSGYRFPGVGDDGLYCPQLCLKVLHSLCDEKNQVYLDEKGDRFWRKVAPEEIMDRLGDEASGPSGAFLRRLARLPEATKELRRLSKGPVEFRWSVLARRGKYSSLLVAGKANRLLTATSTADERRQSCLAFMYAQGLVTRGTHQDSLVFPNDVARLLVNETILPQGKKVIMRKWRDRVVVATKLFWDPITRKLKRRSG